MVWDRPGFAAKPPPPPPFALFNPTAPQGPITKGLSRHAGRLPFYSSERAGEPPFQEEIIILFTRARGRFFAPARLRSL